MHPKPYSPFDDSIIFFSELTQIANLFQQTDGISMFGIFNSHRSINDIHTIQAFVKGILQCVSQFFLLQPPDTLHHQFFFEIFNEAPWGPFACESFKSTLRCEHMAIAKAWLKEHMLKSKDKQTDVKRHSDTTGQKHNPTPSCHRQINLFGNKALLMLQ